MPKKKRKQISGTEQDYMNGYLAGTADARAGKKPQKLTSAKPKRWNNGYYAAYRERPWGSTELPEIEKD